MAFLVEGEPVALVIVNEVVVSAPVVNSMFWRGDVVVRWRHVWYGI